LLANQTSHSAVKIHSRASMTTKYTTDSNSPQLSECKTQK